MMEGPRRNEATTNFQGAEMRSSMGKTVLNWGIAAGLLIGYALGAEPETDKAIRVGASAVEIAADDSMIIGGSIQPGRATGQEGQLRAVAVVLEKPGAKPNRLAIVAC